MYKFLTSRWIHIWIAMVCPRSPSSPFGSPSLSFAFYHIMISFSYAPANTNTEKKSILTSLACFTFTTNFKRTSPFAHLLPSWSGLVIHPIDTISQALSVYRMHVDHNSMRVREQRHRRIDDAEKRRQYRVAHGLEEASEKDEQASAPAEGKEQEEKRPVKKWLGIW